MLVQIKKKKNWNYIKYMKLLVKTLKVFPRDYFYYFETEIWQIQHFKRNVWLKIKSWQKVHNHTY